MDHELKLIRAHYHLQQLDTEMNAWLDIQRQSIVTEPDPDNPGYFLVKVTAPRPPADPFGVMVGDCVHNMRSALDHLAFALLKRHTPTLTDKLIKDSEFPIFGDEDRQGNTGAGPKLFHNGAMKTKIAGVAPAAQTEIERLQPYHRGKDWRGHHLWVLSVLANIDKHRLIHPVVAAYAATVMKFAHGAAAGFAIPYRAPGDIGYAMHVFDGIVEGETVVARVQTRPSMDGDEMTVDFDVPLKVMFEQAAPGDPPGESIVDTLAAIYSYIRTDVFPPLTPYL